MVEQVIIYDHPYNSMIRTNALKLSMLDYLMDNLPYPSLYCPLLIINGQLGMKISQSESNLV
jgi:hypothetical protein